MTARTKNLVVAGGAVVVAGFVGVNVFMTSPATPAAEDPTQLPGTASSPGNALVPAPAPSASTGPGAIGGPTTEIAVGTRSAGRRSYAIGLHDLAGLPPDAAPGQALELWVTWEPPITREPRLHELIRDARLERIVSGSTPEAPLTVLLSVPAVRVGDLIYADTFGKLNVVLPG